MARFDLYNAAGFGFNMSATSDSGWAFVAADPNVTTQLVYDDGDVAIYGVYGSSVFDTLGVDYWTDGYNIQITQILYMGGGNTILDISNLNLWTTVDDLQSSAWFVRLNSSSDEFYGNDYRDIIRGGFGNDVVVGFAGNDDLFGDAGDDWLNGGLGYDLLSGGDGFDTAFFAGPTSNFSFTRNADGSVTVADGAGVYDLLHGIEAVAFDNGTFSLDSLVPVPPPPPTPEQVYAGDNTLKGTGGSNVLNGYGGNDKLYGYGGNDKLYGGDGKDYLSGSYGTDYLFGGFGNDILYGGSGKDTFVFNTKPNRYTNKDAIKDFRVIDDTVRLDNAIFTKAGANGTLKSYAFWTNTTGKAHDRDDRVIYDKDSGVLYYDADGTGKAAAVAFATISKSLALTYKDFYII